MYHVLDVCRYVINYSNRKEYGISNLKLQKILYFIQAYFLMNTDDQTPCFGERIEAWDFGPVVPEAYREYKHYGSTNIPDISSYIEYEKENIWDAHRVDFNEDVISCEAGEMISAVVDKFADFSATDLVTLTHKQAPWKNAYVSQMNKEITIEAIKEYFNE